MKLRSSQGLILAAVTLALVTGCGNKESASTETAQPISAGEQIFQAQCSFCHGSEGDGATSIGGGYPAADLRDGQWSFGGSKEQLVKTITNGIPGTPMRGFDGMMSPQDIAEVADYVSKLPQKKAQ